MTRRAYQQTRVFGHKLLAARDHARAGNCKAAKRSFKEATYLAYDLVEALPNVRREVVRKLAMVENILADRACRLPRFHAGVDKRLHRRT